MNPNKPCPLIVTELPYKVTLTFKSEPPGERDLQPVFTKLGQDKCLRKLKVDSINGCDVCVILPASLACLGEGRYELKVHDKCCNDCDSVEIWFMADCEIVEAKGENCETC